MVEIKIIHTQEYWYSYTPLFECKLLHILLINLILQNRVFKIIFVSTHNSNTTKIHTQKRKKRGYLRLHNKLLYRYCL